MFSNRVPQSFTRRIAVAVMIAAVAVLPSHGKKDELTEITVHVVNDKDDPVDRAAVIVKPLKGNKVIRAYELRTSQEGTAPLPPIRTGTILIQVIASGYQTYGEKFEITEPKRTIEVKLNPPQRQYSAHEKR